MSEVSLPEEDCGQQAALLHHSKGGRRSFPVITGLL